MSKIIRTFLIAIAPIALLGLGAEVHAQASDVVCDKCINSSDIAGGAVATSKLKKQAVTKAKLADKAVTTTKIAGGAVTSGKIKNGAVTFGKLSSNVADSINGSIGGLILEQTSVVDGSGVAGHVCPVNTLVGSANCDCEGDGETRNFGVLFGCQLAGNGGVAGCFPEGTLFDPLLPSPLATITLLCVSAVQNDGTPIVPMPVSVNPFGISKIENGGIDFETAVNNTRAAVAAHRNALENR